MAPTTVCCRTMTFSRQTLDEFKFGRTRLVLNFGYQHHSNYIEVWVDTDWAGCRKTRKSTSGGVLRLGNHTVKVWSHTQAVIALSSGGAEYYGMVKGASIALGIKAMLSDLGNPPINPSKRAS